MPSVSHEPPQLLIAYQVTAHGNALERVDVPLPKPQGRDVLLRVSACDTDLHL